MSKNARTTGSALCAETKKALGLLKDTIGQMESEALSLDELSRCNAHQNPFGEYSSRAYSSTIEQFQRFFQDRWGFTCSDAEVGRVYVPQPRGYCKALLILPPGRVIAGPERICTKWREEKKFNAWTFADGKLDTAIPNDRRHLGMYALLHKGTRDADEELRNRSFEQNRSDGELLKIAKTEDTMRATEVLFFKDFHFQSKEEHIDPQTVTLTSSLSSDGLAVYVYWCGHVSVDQDDVQSANPDWASRAAAYL